MSEVASQLFNAQNASKDATEALGGLSKTGSEGIYRRFFDVPDSTQRCSHNILESRVQEVGEHQCHEKTNNWTTLAVDDNVMQHQSCVRFFMR